MYIVSYVHLPGPVVRELLSSAGVHTESQAPKRLKVATCVLGKYFGGGVLVWMFDTCACVASEKHRREREYSVSAMAQWQMF